MKLKDRTAIITGGTGALGKAVVSAFLEEGAKVACTYIFDEELKHCSSLAEKYKSNLVFIQSDVTKEKAAAEAVQKNTREVWKSRHSGKYRWRIYVCQDRRH